MSLPRTASSRTPFAAALLVVWAAWLWANPYQGIWHDARVYLVMAYRHVVPEAFERDVWFLFGSQDRSSLFDEVYALLLRLGPVDATAKVVALGGGVTWAIGAFWFAHTVIGPRWGLWAAVLLSVLAPPYTFVDSRIFVLTESFATARPYAMGLTLIGVAAHLTGRHWVAVVALFTGFVFHPLIAIWGILVLAGCRIADSALAVILVVGSLAAIVAAAAGYERLEPMAGLWFQLVQNTSAVVFAPTTDAVALDQNLWWLAILLLGGRLGATPYRRLYLLVAWLAAWGFLASLVLSFYYPAVWPVQAQPWRALWLAAAVGIVAGIDLVKRLQEPAHRWHWLAALLASYMLAGRAFGGTLLLAAWCVYVCPWLRRALTSLWSRLSRSSQKFIEMIGELWLVGVTVFCSLPLTYVQRSVPWTDVHFVVPTILTGLVVPLLLTWIVINAKGAARVLRAVPLVVLAWILWDQRTAAQRLMESGYSVSGQEAQQDTVYRRGEVVYWPDNELGPWFELATAGYAQNVQSIGIVFSQDHALLIHDRLRRIRNLQPSTQWEGQFNEHDLHAPFYHPIRWDGRALAALCMDRELDHVILSSPAHELDAHVTTQRASNGALLHVYHCAVLRGGAASREPAAARFR